MVNEQKQFTFIPKGEINFKADMLAGLKDLPGQISSVTAQGVDAEVTFPIYQADPAGFFDGDFDTISLKDLKDKLRPLVIDYKSPETQYSQTLPADFLKIDTANQAKLLSEYMLAYQKRPALQQRIQSLVAQSVSNPPEGMTSRTQAVSLVAYVGHYLGDDNAELFINAMQNDVDLDATRYGALINGISRAKEVISQKNGVIQDFNAMPLSDDQRVASTVNAVYELGLDSSATHSLAHFATMSKNQPKTSDEPSVKRSI
jgi:hypothetical protein